MELDVSVEGEAPPLLRLSAACHAIDKLDHICQLQTGKEMAEVCKALHKLKQLFHSEQSQMMTQGTLDTFLHS